MENKVTNTALAIPVKRIRKAYLAISKEKAPELSYQTSMGSVRHNFSSAKRTIPILLTMRSFVLLHHEMEYSFTQFSRTHTFKKGKRHLFKQVQSNTQQSDTLLHHNCLPVSLFICTSLLQDFLPEKPPFYS